MKLIPSVVVLLADDLEDGHEVLLAEMIDVIVEEVEVEVDHEEGTDALCKGLAPHDLCHQLIRHFRGKAEMDTAVLWSRVELRSDIVSLLVRRLLKIVNELVYAARRR